jgi:hypothetical protein
MGNLPSYNVSIKISTNSSFQNPYLLFSPQGESRISWGQYRGPHIRTRLSCDGTIVCFEIWILYKFAHKLAYETIPDTVQAKGKEKLDKMKFQNATKFPSLLFPVVHKREDQYQHR